MRLQRLDAHAVKEAAKGGKDGFRLFPDFKETGSGICNSCGPRSDGFAMLQWVNGWNFPEVVKQVGRFLCMEEANQPEIIKTVSDGSQVSGIIATLTTIKVRDKSFFQVGFKNGATFWGNDLKRAVLVADLKVGDRAELTLVSRQFCRKDGKEFKRSLWSARKLPTPEEEKAAALAKKQLYAERRRVIKEVWNKSVPLNLAAVNPASLYLAKRGIKEDALSPLKLGGDIRFVEELTYTDDDGVQENYPALVCAVRDVKGKPITLHRIYLNGKGGKADVATPKKLMPVGFESGIVGCGIRIGETPSDVLCVAEGVETSIAVVRATGLPCWSAVSAGGMKTLEIPETVKTVYIFADKDRSQAGQKAAQALKDKLKDKGVKAVILLPEEQIEDGKKGVDWNDHLIKYGPSSFPI